MPIMARDVKMLEEHEIAMAYVDIKMPGPSGLEAIKLGKEISPDTVIIS